MNQSIYTISFLDLLWISIPVVIVIAIFLRWSMGIKSALHGFLRMFVQLVLIGYALVFIFNADQPVIIIGILCIMLGAAGMIAMRPLREKRRSLYLKAIAARLCDEARGGQILINQKTLGIIEDPVETEQLEPLNLKGFSQPISTFNVLNIK